MPLLWASAGARAMMEDKPSILERLSVAFNARSLSPGGKLDCVIAVGMAAVRLDSGASALIHLALGRDLVSSREALATAIRITRNMGVKHSWRLRLPEVESVAATALRFYACPICPGCLGRKFLVIPGTPSLSTRMCPKCRGTGLRPYPARHGDKIARVVDRLSTIEADFGREVIRVLR